MNLKLIFSIVCCLVLGSLGFYLFNHSGLTSLKGYNKYGVVIHNGTNTAVDVSTWSLYPALSTVTAPNIQSKNITITGGLTIQDSFSNLMMQVYNNEIDFDDMINAYDGLYVENGAEIDNLFVDNQEVIGANTVPGGAPGYGKLVTVQGAGDVGISMFRNSSSAYSFFEAFDENSNSVFRLNEFFQLLIGAGMDVGIGRNTNGVLEVNSGTPGDFRDLLVRTLITTGSKTITNSFVEQNGTTNQMIYINGILQSWQKNDVEQ